MAILTLQFGMNSSYIDVKWNGILTACDLGTKVEICHVYKINENPKDKMKKKMQLY